MHVYFWLCLTAVKSMRRVDVLVLLLLYSAGLFSVEALGERVSSLCG